jgi:hypothetical protein
MEAVKYTSTVTDRKSNWNGESQAYSNTYTSPVVVGQVMTYNDPDPSVFWSRGSGQGDPPDSSNLYTGKHVGEDSDTDRLDETIGYIVIESGSGTMDGLDYAVALGGDSVQGMTNSPPYDYGLSGWASVDSAVASIAAMDGGDGAWAVMYGSTPLTTTNLALAADEDQVGDSERGHTTEQVAYVVFGQAAMTLAAPPAGEGDLVGEVLTAAPDETLVLAAASSWGRPELAEMEIVVADLGGSILGYEADGVIYLDDDAGGYGWFVDATPYDDAEFDVLTEAGLAAAPGSAAYGKADLLTVLRHEFGHALGQPHAEAGSSSVMSETLELGLRKVLQAVPDDDVVDLLAAL